MNTRERKNTRGRKEVGKDEEQGLEDAGLAQHLGPGTPPLPCSGGAALHGGEEAPRGGLEGPNRPVPPFPGQSPRSQVNRKGPWTSGTAAGRGEGGRRAGVGPPRHSPANGTAGSWHLALRHGPRHPPGPRWPSEAGSTPSYRWARRGTGVPEMPQPAHGITRPCLSWALICTGRVCVCVCERVRACARVGACWVPHNHRCVFSRSQRPL